MSGVSLRQRELKPVDGYQRLFRCNKKMWWKSKSFRNYLRNTEASFPLAKSLQCNKMKSLFYIYRQNVFLRVESLWYVFSPLWTAPKPQFPGLAKLCWASAPRGSGRDDCMAGGWEGAGRGRWRVWTVFTTGLSPSSGTIWRGIITSSSCLLSQL